MSQQSVRQNYVQADVLSASPQKLQLLLVEAAMKNVLKTKKFWEEGNISDAFDTLTRAQDIVAEILCSLDVEKSPDIAKKLGSIYVFIFRRLCEAGMSQDLEKLNDAYRVLMSERETWKLVCEKFGSSKTGGAISSVGETAQMPVSAATQRSPGTTAWSSSTPHLAGAESSVPAPLPHNPQGNSAGGTYVNSSASFAPSTPKPVSPNSVAYTPTAKSGAIPGGTSPGKNAAGTYTPGESKIGPQSLRSSVSLDISGPTASLPSASGTLNFNNVKPPSADTPGVNTPIPSSMSGGPGTGSPVLPTTSAAFQPQIPAMPFVGPGLGTGSPVPGNLGAPGNPGISGKSGGTTKPAPSHLGIPLGGLDLVNPLGHTGPLPKLEPMSNPPQNANAPATDAISTNTTLQTPSRPVSGVPSRTGFSWDG